MPDSPNAKPPPKDWAKSLLGWYYSTGGTLIRVAFYLIVILMVVAWSRGWFSAGSSKAPPAPRRLEHLQVIGWKEKRWATAVSPHLKLGEFPYIEVTLAEPEGFGVSYKLADLAALCQLFAPDAQHAMLSLPIEAVEAGSGAAAKGAKDAVEASTDEATQAHSFNGQVILSFYVNPETLDQLPDEIWLGYREDEGPTPSTAARHQVVHMASLTKANFQGVEMLKTKSAGKATPSSPATPPAPTAPTAPDVPAVPPLAPAEPLAPAPAH